MGHAKVILSLDQNDQQLLLHDLILQDELNVRETEQAALRIGEKGKKSSFAMFHVIFILRN